MPSKEAKRVQNVGLVGRHFVAQKFQTLPKLSQITTITD